LRLDGVPIGSATAGCTLDSSDASRFGMLLRPLVIAVLCLALAPAASGRPGADAARARAKVTFELGQRTGYEYRWEYTIRLRIRDRATGDALQGLRVLATGQMNAPGHAMRTLSVRARDQGAGVYSGNVAFYMPGSWRVRVSVRGANVLPALVGFPVLLQ